MASQRPPGETARLFFLPRDFVLPLLRKCHPPSLPVTGVCCSLPDRPPHNWALAPWPVCIGPRAGEAHPLLSCPSQLPGNIPATLRPPTCPRSSALFPLPGKLAPAWGGPRSVLLACETGSLPVPQAWSGAQVQQELRVGGSQEEADTAGEVRPHPAGPHTVARLHGEVCQEGQALLLCAAVRVCLEQARG